MTTWIRMIPEHGATDVATMEASGIATLRRNDCTDGDILEVNQFAACFNYSNRLLNGLGVTTDGDSIGYNH